MTMKTHKIEDIEVNIVTTENDCKHICIIQRKDVIVFSCDQARQIAALIDEV